MQKQIYCCKDKHIIQLQITVINYFRGTSFLDLQKLLYASKCCSVNNHSQVTSSALPTEECGMRDYIN
jgi:hypothetical protein